jgi:hypothetical protein
MTIVLVPKRERLPHAEFKEPNAIFALTLAVNPPFVMTRRFRPTASHY